jgi:hypothetical protein
LNVKGDWPNKKYRIGAEARLLDRHRSWLKKGSHYQTDKRR